MLNDRLDAMLQAASLAGLSTSLLLVAGFIYFLSGLVKGTLGVGFPTTAVSLLAQITDARTAISLVILPMIVTNAWQIWRSRQILWVFKSYWPLLLIMIVFMGLSTQLASVVPIAYITLFLGAVISLYAATTLYKPIFKISPEKDTKAQIVAGITSGVMGGISGIWGPPIMMYLNARGISKEQFVAAAGILLFAGSSVIFVGYWKADIIGPSITLISCALLLPSMAGMILGERVRKTLSANRFERLLLWMFLIMGLNLIRRAVW